MIAWEENKKGGDNNEWRISVRAWIQTV
jgi:hypothetical protein